MNLEDALEELLDSISNTPGVRPVSYGLGTLFPAGQAEGTWHMVFGVRLQAGRQFLHRLAAAVERNKDLRCVLVDGDMLRPEPYLTFCLEPLTLVPPTLVVQALNQPLA